MSFVDSMMFKVSFLSTPSARRATSSPRAAPMRATISIHALREEGDQAAFLLYIPPIKFLSTPSARRATPAIVKGMTATNISIHALREEGDTTV